MADAKLSELTAATSAAASDTTYLVQSSTSKKITVANLFGSIATPAIFSDKIQIQDTDTQVGAGAVDLTTNITYLSNPDANHTLTLASGANGQIKILIMTANTGANTYTLSGSNVAGSVAFSSAGDTATLIYTSDKWFVIGGTATVS